MTVIWWCLTLGFAALNVYAIAVGDLAGLIAYLGNLGPWGILATVDLLLALFVGLYWIVRHARAHGRSAVPFVILTLATGSLGLLLYMALRGASPAAVGQETDAAAAGTD